MKPECKRCRIELEEIGGIGKDFTETDHRYNIIGVREVILYQCEECKTVVLI